MKYANRTCPRHLEWGGRDHAFLVTAVKLGLRLLELTSRVLSDTHVRVGAMSTVIGLTTI